MSWAADLLVRPRVGRMPTRLQCEAGPLTELPVSVPSPTRARLAATAARRHTSPSEYCLLSWAALKEVLVTNNDEGVVEIVLQGGCTVTLR